MYMCITNAYNYTYYNLFSNLIYEIKRKLEGVISVELTVEGAAIFFAINE